MSLRELKRLKAVQEAIDPNRVKTIDELNREYAEKVLELAEGNRSKAANILGISRTSLWRILKK